MTTPELRLFCLPYAGGSSHVFRDWAVSMPAWVEVCPVELPGRGTRFNDEPLDHFEPVVTDLIRVVLGSCDMPFAFLGYSYGALLAFELARRLARRHGLVARRLIVAAMRAPGWPSRTPPVSALPDREFRQHLRSLGGTPPEVLRNDALMELMSPVLRADFRAVETYLYRPQPKLSCPIAAIGGDSDHGVTAAALAGWRECTTGRLDTHIVPGGHFFLTTARGQFQAAVARFLEASCGLPTSMTSTT